MFKEGLLKCIYTIQQLLQQRKFYSYTNMQKRNVNSFIDVHVSRELLCRLLVDIIFYNADKFEECSRKRKLLKVDQLLLSESKIKPVGSKQRKVKEKNRQAENPSDSSDSEIDEDKCRPAAVKMNNKHKTLATFDLWKTEGNEAVQYECLF